MCLISLFYLMFWFTFHSILYVLPFFHVRLDLDDAADGLDRDDWRDIMEIRKAVAENMGVYHRRVNLLILSRRLGTLVQFTRAECKPVVDESCPHCSHDPICTINKYRRTGARSTRSKVKNTEKFKIRVPVPV